MKAIIKIFLSPRSNAKTMKQSNGIINISQETNNIDKIIYINLSLRDDRRKFMESQLRKINLPYERFNAIRPTQDDIKKGGKYYEYWLRGNCNTGTLGVYLSHYSIHKKALKEKWNNYLLLEDDVIIDKNCLQQLNKYLNEKIIPDDWDMVRSLWGSHLVEVNKFTSSFILSRYCSSDSHEDWGGSHFTLINKKNISKLINLMENDNVISPDGVYGTDMLNVYHSKFGIRIDNSFGTDIQHISKPKGFLPKKIRNMI